MDDGRLTEFYVCLKALYIILSQYSLDREHGRGDSRQNHAPRFTSAQEARWKVELCNYWKQNSNVKYLDKKIIQWNALRYAEKNKLIRS